MKKLQPIILLFSILFSSCEKSDIPENYPSIYVKLFSSILPHTRASFATKNPYLVTSVNEFGFCDYLDELIDVVTPPIQASVSESEAIEIAKHFIALNSSETGVNNSQDISFYKTSTDTGFSGVIRWHLKTANQKIDTIEVMYTRIFIHLTNGVVTSCYDNWYRDIFIPSHFNISQNKAKEDLMGKTLSHYNINGDEFVTISRTDIDNCTVNLKVLPVETTDKIELHVCWQIYIPNPVNYIIYVDVMTGKIINQDPTVIS